MNMIFSSTNKRDITVGLVDDEVTNELYIARDLDQADDISVSFIAVDGLDMQQKIKTVGAPRVILLDQSMSRMPGYEAALWLKKNYPKTKVLVYSAIGDRLLVLRMLRAGARGFIFKGGHPTDLAEAIRQVAHHDYLINALVTADMAMAAKKRKIPNELDFFTLRRLEFLHLVSEDLTFKEIAALMAVSEVMVNRYSKECKAFFKVNSVAKLILECKKLGMLPLSMLQLGMIQNRQANRNKNNK